MRYASIRTMDISNGPGIRVSIFVSGCGFHCPGCFNDEAQDFDFGKTYTEKTEETLVDLVARPQIVGLSILGGDPLWQNNEGIESLTRLCKRVHSIGKTVWIWSGFKWEELFDVPRADISSLHEPLRKLIEQCDVFVDGRYVEKLKDYRLKWRGSSNQRVIDVKKSLEAKSPVLVEDT